MKGATVDSVAASRAPSPLLRRLQDRKLVIPTIFLFALLVQTLFVLLLPSRARRNESADYFEYYSPVAQNILSGKGMVDASGKLGTLYPPGHPIFLAGAFALADSLGVGRVTFVVLLNALLMSLSCLLVYWTAQRIFTTRIAVISAGLWITYLFNLWLMKQPNSEVPFIPLLYATVYCVIRAMQKQAARFAAVSGLLLGAAALIRPIAVLLAFVLATGLLLNRTISFNKRLMYAALVVGIFLLAVLPWECEVYVETRQVVPLSTNGPSSVLDGLTFTSRSGKGGVPASVVEFTQRTWDHQHELKTMREILRYLASELEQDRKAVLELYALKLARSWFGTDTGSRERPILLIQLVYLMLAGFGIFLAALRFPQQRYYLALFLSLVVYFWGMAVIALSIVRYMVPVMAYLLIPGAVALDALIGCREGLRADGTEGLPRG